MCALIIACVSPHHFGDMIDDGATRNPATVEPPGKITLSQPLIPTLGQQWMCRGRRSIANKVCNVRQVKYKGRKMRNTQTYEKHVQLEAHVHVANLR